MESASIGIQCDLWNLLVQMHNSATPNLDSSNITDSVSASQANDSDPSWLPSTHSELHTESEKTSTSCHISDPNSQLHKASKFIIFHHSLLQLFSFCHCPYCSSYDIITSHRTNGTLLSLDISCFSCSHSTIWHSQPFFQNIPADNLLLSASILFSGATPTKVLWVLSNMNIAAVSIQLKHSSDTRG